MSRRMFKKDSFGKVSGHSLTTRRKDERSMNDHHDITAKDTHHTLVANTTQVNNQFIEWIQQVEEEWYDTLRTTKTPMRKSQRGRG